MPHSVNRNGHCRQALLRNRSNTSLLPEVESIAVKQNEPQTTMQQASPQSFSPQVRSDDKPLHQALVAFYKKAFQLAQIEKGSRRQHYQKHRNNRYRLKTKPVTRDIAAATKKILIMLTAW